MPGLTPEMAKGALQMALITIKKEHGTTRNVIEAIPAGGGDYKPEPAARTALEIAWHIVASEHRFFSSVVKGFFDVTPNPKPDSLKTGADIAKHYDELLLKVHTALGELSGENLAKEMGFSRHVPDAGRRVFGPWHPPLGPPPRPAFGLPTTRWRKGSGHLRRELRLEE
jgi:DinB family